MTQVIDRPLPAIEKDSVDHQAVAEQRVELGGHIVADPRICHGRLTFRGTRIFVADVLEDVAAGMDWEQIQRNWHGSVTKEGISEAVVLARLALLAHWPQISQETPSE